MIWGLLIQARAGMFYLALLIFTVMAVDEWGAVALIPHAVFLLVVINIYLIRRFCPQAVRDLFEDMANGYSYDREGNRL